MWRTVAKVEHQDHYTHEVTLANLYSGSDNVANLETAVAQTRQTAQDYDSLGAQLPGGSKAQRELRALATRERGNAALLDQALAADQANGATPRVPRVKSVAVQTATAAKYSGNANGLTNNQTGALTDAAWLWAQDQWMAKTAVDTGNAKLAALFSGLENQERQNWTDISNAAGYVNDTATNLRASIQAEQGAQQMYTDYAQQAKNAGNTSVADVFTSIKGDELGHEQTFQAELQDLTGSQS
ncbi:MAG TPA: ferritin family protein [Thermoleophilaceae bacterium]|nr:ferritin family protein [Thermoleophilaceae bacterium]